MTQTEKLMTDIYGFYYPILVRYFQKRTSHLYLAEDLSQDTFLRLTEYRHILIEATAGSLLFRIARNILADHIRHQYVKKEFDHYWTEIYVGETNDIEDKLFVKDLLCIEERALKRLPDIKREIYYLNRYEDKSAEEIAAILRVNKKTVDNSLYTGRKHVRNWIKKCV